MDSEGFNNEKEPVEDGKILLIIDASERSSCYMHCYFAEHVARVPEHKSWHHQLPLQDATAKTPTVAIYKTI